MTFTYATHQNRTLARRLATLTTAPKDPTWTHEGVTYRYERRHILDTLYGALVLFSSQIPDGLTMTLRTVRGQELTLRGERHGDEIKFVHICGASLELGAWVPVEGEA